MIDLLNIIGIGTAYAAGAAHAGTTQTTGQSIMSMLPMLLAFVLIFYFLLIRPQSKRQKEHKQLVSQLEKGDEIVTSGGVLGKVEKVADDFLQLIIAKDVSINIQRSSVSMVLPKGTIEGI